MPSIQTILFVLWLLWGIPCGIYRSRFRKIVYQTTDWTINIKPYFWKENKGLFGNLYPQDAEYLRMRNFYRAYLVVYAGLFAAYKIFG